MISVIVPVFNIQDYIGNCIESIITQSYPDLEIILVDDGSTDRSGNICNEYMKADERIQVIHQTNKGLSAARNSGLDAAKGEYICFVDGDDFIHRDMFMYMTHVLEKQSVELVACDFVLVSANQSFLKATQIKDDEDIHIYSRDEAMSKISASSCGKLYRADLFKTIRYPVGRYHEDEYVIHQLIYQTHKVAKLDIGLYFYVKQRAGSITTKAIGERIDDALGAYDARIMFVEQREWNEVKRNVLESYTGYLLGTFCNQGNGLTKTEIKMLQSKMKEIVKNYKRIPFGCKCFALNPLLYKILRYLNTQIGKIMYRLENWRV